MEFHGVDDIVDLRVSSSSSLFYFILFYFISFYFILFLLSSTNRTIFYFSRVLTGVQPTGIS